MEENETDKTFGNYKLLNPIESDLFEKGKEKELRDEFVYLQAHFLKNLPKVDRKRRYYRVVNGDNFIIRQVRGFWGSKKFIKDNEIYPITMSYLNEIELEANDGDIIEIKRLEIFDMFRYFLRHPSRDVRIASIALMIGLIIGLISIVIGVWGLLIDYGVITPH